MSAGLDAAGPLRREPPSARGWGFPAGGAKAVQASAWPTAIALGFVVLAVLRVAAAWPVFSTTYDEPAHLAAGMQWLDRGIYRYEPQHPPLARVFAALGPWLDGSRSAGLPEMWAEGDAVLRGRGTDQRTLVLARAGILPFLVVGAFGVWWWARRAFGAWAACIAVGFFTTLPLVLGHAGFATTDMAFTACFTLAVLATCRWVDAPGASRAAMAGAALAVAALAKFTLFPFLLASGFAILLWHLLLGWRGGAALPWRALFRTSPALILVAFVTVWAGYRFSIAPIAALNETVHPMLDAAVPPGWRGLARRLADTPIPLSELFFGIAAVLKHNAQGHTSFLLGEFRSGGWWQFFPVAALVKTPLPFLLLAAAGVGATLAASWRARDWRVAVPALCALAILLSVLPSRINIGLRHVLPIFPFLAIAAGYAAMRMVARWRGAGIAIVGLALAWQVAGGLRAHPDQLAWFNEIAGDRPERALLISDLDWGQDALRLAQALEERRVASLTAFLLGQCDGFVSRDLSRLGFPPTHRLEPGERPAGWVAVSETVLATPAAAWLRALREEARIGRSIRLYRLPDDPGRSPAGPLCGTVAPRRGPLEGWVNPAR